MSVNDPWARPNDPGSGEYIPPLPPAPDPAAATPPTLPDGYAYPQPTYQAPGYPPPPPGYPPAYPPSGYQHYHNYPPYQQPPVNGLGIAGMVCAIVGVVTCWIWFLGLIVSVIGVTLSHVALSAIRRERQGGEGFAIAGIAVGWVGVALGLIVVIGVFNGPGRLWW